MRLTRRLRRAATPYWLGVAVLAVATAAAISSATADARRLAERHGAPRTVPVALRAVPAGTVLTDEDVGFRPVPSAFLPAAAVARRPLGVATLVDLAAGEVVLASRLATEGARGPAALVPPGARAVAVPSGPGGRPPLQRGDRVDVLATLGDGTTGDPTVVVALDALVVHVDDDVVTVAVAVEDAPRVAFAVTSGAVTLALAGHGG